MKLQYIATVAAASLLSTSLIGFFPNNASASPLRSSKLVAVCAGSKPCAGAKPCAASNPCAGNPCAGAGAANPCAGNPCAGAGAANPCAGNPCASNPCAGS